eukprot:TRINITY_DN4441_c0_g1_i1.p1 TRINITY_DN4441_c0_g1~~TRINITY_DN4441_c0_g1_i1.p1  ORF type:complete len:280 (-),score=40.01 TRINITY_DN4441_c0_g1_i1:223-1029(-)
MSKDNTKLLADIQWAYPQYDELLQQLAGRKSRANTKVRLPQLDNWYRKELPALLARDKYMTVEQLGDVVEWKQLRGKWRPQNWQMAKGNDDDHVQAVTKKAFSMCDKEQYVKAVTYIAKELRGVGPATATAILAAYDGSVPFMSDEGMAAALKSSRLEYTLKGFERYTNAMEALLAELNSDGSEDGPPCVCRLERSLWSLGEVERGGTKRSDRPIKSAEALPRVSPRDERKRKRDEAPSSTRTTAEVPEDVQVTKERDVKRKITHGPS